MKMQVLEFHPRPTNEKLWVWGPAFCAVPSLSGNSEGNSEFENHCFAPAPEAGKDSFCASQSFRGLLVITSLINYLNLNPCFWGNPSYDNVLTFC